MLFARTRLSAGAVALTLLGSPLIFAQAGRTTANGVYTSGQATRGQALFNEQCSPCHGATLAGGSGPPLSGAAFLGVWDKQLLADLVDKIRDTMPATSPGTLTRVQATDVAGFILQANAFPVGRVELKADDTLKQIAIVGVAGTPAPVARPVSASIPAARPLGNLAQVMRGILFPSSNLIFNVQTHDPGERKIGWTPGGATPFSWVDWGAGIYSGWELVDYAAVALAESAPLMLTPGRRCENGKPVPVDRPDWVKFVAELAEAGRAAYRASQSRNQDAVAEVTNQVSDACLNCHQVYRDKPAARDALDQSNKAARCVP
jgi:mono/diheme cytochrome c family protein